MASLISNAEPIKVVVVGGGFSGTMVAVQLARMPLSCPVHVVLFEKGPRFARGLAYGTSCERHLLNVPASLMSALPELPTHFFDWLHARDPDTQPSTFAPRSVYGEYLEDLLESIAGTASFTIERVNDDVIDLLATDSTYRRFAVLAGSGRLVYADRVVLALGNQPPQTPPGLEHAEAFSRYIRDPWNSDLFDSANIEETVGLIGSGLTAIDVVVEANHRGHRGNIMAISRHGLVPFRHRLSPRTPHFDLGASRPTARALLKAVRTQAVRCEAEGGDWRSVVDGIRPLAQHVWKSLGEGEQRRFVRHLAPRWDVHRHRVAPEIDDLLQSRFVEGRFSVLAGRIIEINEDDGGLALTVQRRGGTGTEIVHVGRLINCTGPARDIRHKPSRLIRALLDHGLVQPGPLALGLDATETGALIAADGRTHEHLFAIGPLLKDHLWETTAVRELRVQAAELARRLIDLG